MIFKKSLRSLAIRLSILPLCFLFAMASLAAFPSHNDNGGDKGFSGEQLLRGIFFAQGPVAKHIPVLQAFEINSYIKDANVRADITTFQNGIVNKISTEHLGFLKKLETAVGSKNNFKIQQILKEGDQLITNVSMEITAKGQKTTPVTEKQVESTAAKALSNDTWVLLPVCVFFSCIHDRIVIEKLKMPDGELFREKLITDISKL